MKPSLKPRKTALGSIEKPTLTAVALVGREPETCAESCHLSRVCHRLQMHYRPQHPSSLTGTTNHLPTICGAQAGRLLADRCAQGTLPHLHLFRAETERKGRSFGVCKIIEFRMERPGHRQHRQSTPRRVHPRPCCRDTLLLGVQSGQKDAWLRQTTGCVNLNAQGTRTHHHFFQKCLGAKEGEGDNSTRSSEQPCRT